MWRLKTSAHVSLLLCSGLLACGHGVLASSFAADESAAKPSPPNAPAIVIGFVGGFVRHDNTVHSVVQLAARLRKAYPSGVYVRVFENHRGEQAHQEILKLLDANHDGTLSDEEKRNARIILYGMSWGGSETVALARELENDKIPVLLTIQVDSVAKRGENDRSIPPNVAEAVNFYQSGGFLHGETHIQAEDASRTRILGNFRYEYKSMPVACENYPWYDRVFFRQHTEIECDPAVWNRAESLIRSKLQPNGAQQQESGIPGHALSHRTELSSVPASAPSTRREPHSFAPPATIVP
jgi:hypothetical protein